MPYAEENKCSKAFIEAAEKALREFEEQSDQDFLDRQKIMRILDM